jgi:hypothetical protein
MRKWHRERLCALTLLLYHDTIMADLDDYAAGNNDDDMLGGGEPEVDDDEDILDMENEAPPASDVLLMRFCPQDSSILYPQASCYFL